MGEPDFPPWRVRRPRESFWSPASEGAVPNGSARLPRAVAGGLIAGSPAAGLGEPTGAPRGSEPRKSVREASLPCSSKFRLARTTARRWIVPGALLIVGVLILSGFSGLVRAQGAIQIQITGLNPLVLAVGQQGTLFLNVSNGAVNGAHGYSLFWFFGKTNASAIETKRQGLSAPGPCLGYPPNVACPFPVADQINVSYSAPGSYDVSVTVYDGLLGNYSIATTPISVYDNLSLPCDVVESPAPPAASIEGQNVSFVARANPAAGVTYYWDFGDGTHSYGDLSFAGQCGNDKWQNHAIHAFTDPGLHLVSLTVSDQFGGVVRKWLFVNTTNPRPSIALVKAQNNATLYSPAWFEANSTDSNPGDIANQTFVWNWGDGSSNLSVKGNGAGCSSGVCWASSTVNHTYRLRGTYTVSVRSTDEENPVANSPGPAQTNVTVTGFSISGCLTGSGLRNASIGWIVGTIYAAPLYTCVGPLPPACSSASSHPRCFAIEGTYYNETWASPTGTDYGQVGRVGSYDYGTQQVPITVKDPTGGTVQSVQMTMPVVDTPPTVGVVAAYSVAWMNLTMGSPCPYTSIQLSLIENAATTVASGTMLGGCNQNPSYSLAKVDLYYGNTYSLQIVYTPTGSGTDLGTLAFGFAGTGARPTYQWTFQNANPSTWAWTLDPAHAAVGMPVYLKTQIFSPADTSLTTKWVFGDGTSFTYTSPAPSQYGPTLVTYTVVHAWAPNGNYAFSVTTTDPVVGAQGGLSGSDAFQVIEGNDVSVSDTAPQVALGSLPAIQEGVPGTYTASVSQVDLTLGSSSVRWSWGDNTTSSGSATVVHVYEYSGSYAVVVFASSPGGSTDVNWSFVRVWNYPPIVRIVCPAVGYVGTSLTLTAAGSTDGLSTSGDLAFGWDFGDNAATGGFGRAGATVNHVYGSTETFTASVTVTSLDGLSAGGSCTIRVLSFALGGTILAPTVYAGRYSTFTITLPNATRAILPYTNITWGWGGGWGTVPSSALGEFGFVVGHTYLVPGSYTIQANLTSPGCFPYSTSAVVTVVDPAPRVSFGWSGGIVYGENHTAPFNATAYGTWGDRFGSQNWQFNWSWGDSSTPSLSGASAGSGYTSAGHVYNASGSVNLSVFTVSPWPQPLAANTTVLANLVLIPDADGDGLPNIFEAVITKTSPYLTSTPNHDPLPWGTGFTDYLTASFDGLLSNLSADADGDGLSNAQELFGSVTGFTSNPLDPNTAGDGISDGGHFFTDSFAGASVVALNSSASPAASVVIPGVQYGGVSAGFNQSRIVVQLSTPSTNNFAYLSLYLVNPTGRSFQLANPVTNFTQTFFLLNDSPATGVTSPLGISLTDFATRANWTLEVYSSSSSVTGSVASVILSNSYYTNPSLADPYHQGLIEPNSITTAVYNCSASQTESYPTVSWKTLSIVNQSYWPYTETYYKLSVLQGVPYVPGTNTSVGAENQASGNCSALGTTPAASTATYLGDADFGISPWNSHAAGDPSLTNGMKALGAANYDATAWQYESTSGTMVGKSAPLWSPMTDPYGYDGIAYQYPLNPTALSTAGDGAVDSVAVNPVQPLVLEVNINWATDPAYITTDQSFPDLVAAYLTGTQGGPTLYTPGSTNPSGGSCLFGQCVGSGMTFSFGDHYLFPLDNNISSYTIELDLIHVDLSGTQTDTTLLLSGSESSTGLVQASSGSNINASVRVVGMNRLPTILVNSSEELLNLPGFGPRFVGEQRFYAFYVDVGPSPPAGFQPGLNVILESRKAFLNSTLSTDFQSQSAPACLGGANVTDRNASSSETGVAGTLSIDLSSNPSCATTLLNALIPHNSTGTIGASQVLTTTELELLGLGPQVEQLAAFQGDPNYNSPVGPAPQGWLQSAAESVANFFIGVLVAIGNFLATVVKALAAVGQFLLGLLSRAAGAIAAAASAALQVLQQLLNALVAFAKWLISPIVTPIINAFVAYVTGVNSAVLIIDQYHPNGAGINSTEANAFWTALLGPVYLVGIGAATAIVIVLAILSGISLGTSFILGLLISLILSAALAGLQQHGDMSSVDKKTSFSGTTFALAVQNVTGNVTHTSPGTGSTPGKTASQNDQWRILGGLWALLTDLAALPIGVGLGGQALLQALSPNVAHSSVFEQVKDVMVAIVAFALVFVGIAFDVVGLLSSGGCAAGHPPNLETVAILLSVVAIGLAIYGLLHKDKGSVEDKVADKLNYFTLGIAFVNLGISTYGYIQDCY